jgi:hypothetical protein
MVTPNGHGLCEEIASCKWLVWHGKAARAVTRLRGIHDVLEEIPVLRDSALYWNLRHAWWYLRSNDRYLVNYGRRHYRYKGLPISSAIAESAVNEVVSWRTAKKRQMRWSDEGAHLLAQVRVHDLNGELHPRVFAFPLRQPKPSHDRRAVVYPMRMAA